MSPRRGLPNGVVSGIGTTLPRLRMRCARRSFSTTPNCREETIQMVLLRDQANEKLAVLSPKVSLSLCNNEELI